MAKKNKGPDLLAYIPMNHESLLRNSPGLFAHVALWVTADHSETRWQTKRAGSGSLVTGVLPGIHRSETQQLQNSNESLPLWPAPGKFISSTYPAPWPMQYILPTSQARPELVHLGEHSTPAAFALCLPGLADSVPWLEFPSTFSQLLPASWTPSCLPLSPSL